MNAKTVKAIIIPMIIATTAKLDSEVLQAPTQALVPGSPVQVSPASSTPLLFVSPGIVPQSLALINFGAKLTMAAVIRIATTTAIAIGISS